MKHLIRMRCYEILALLEDQDFSFREREDIKRKARDIETAIDLDQEEPG